jgi:aminoglycoside phosphotransferase (APT) family kinase protein
VTVLAREPHEYWSTHPAEVVTCRSDSGATLRLLCKYSGGVDSTAHGHRGGVAYEAEVYRSVLAVHEVAAPRFHGAYVDAASGWTWLVLEYLDGCLRLEKVAGDAALTGAASWLGTFHAAQERLVEDPSHTFLPRYDEKYYAGWVERARRFAGPLARTVPWFPSVCDEAGSLFEMLLSSPQTVIHGEFYPKNILVRDGRVSPVDWESTAVGPGEIDLAALTEGWGERISRACMMAYLRARGPAGGAAAIGRRLDAARAYLCFRWLGENPALTAQEESLFYFETLRAAATRLGALRGGHAP